MTKVWRVQSIFDGRGPYRPGFSHHWLDASREGGPPPWTDEFPDLLRTLQSGAITARHLGCGVLSKAALSDWFTDTEMAKLKTLGYSVFSMDADVILAKSRHQVVFGRNQPLTVGVSVEL